MAVEMMDFAPNRAIESSAEAASGILSLQIRKRFDAADPANKDSFELDIAVELSPGITILFGPSGAGKTTLLECIAGLLSPNRGRIAIGNRVLFDHVSPSECARPQTQNWVCLSRPCPVSPSNRRKKY